MAGKSDPYVVVCYDGQRDKSKHFKNTLTPEFEFQTGFVTGTVNIINYQMWNIDILSPGFRGKRPCRDSFWSVGPWHWQGRTNGLRCLWPHQGTIFQFVIIQCYKSRHFAVAVIGVCYILDPTRVANPVCFIPDPNPDYLGLTWVLLFIFLSSYFLDLKKLLDPNFHKFLGQDPIPCIT
jgi:hypothetical protein